MNTSLKLLDDFDFILYHCHFLGTKHQCNSIKIPTLIIIINNKHTGANISKSILAKQHFVTAMPTDDYLKLSIFSTCLTDKKKLLNDMVHSQNTSTVT